jgi:hypothetical protein
MEPIALKENDLTNRPFTSLRLPNGNTVRFTFLPEFNHGELVVGIGWACYDLFGERIARDAVPINLTHLLKEQG